jgi:hypothetical protein
LDPDTYEIRLKYCEIRPDKALEGKQRAETAWSVEIGVFKDYLRESKKSLLQNCFEFDWASMKEIKFKKSEREDIKMEMQRVYESIKEAYREQAGFGPSGTIFSIGSNQLNIMMSEVLNCLDTQETGALLSTVSELQFITVNTMRREKYNPA